MTLAHLIVPWLATFLFGCGVFVVGKSFQRAERRRRAVEKAEALQREMLARVLAQMERQEQKKSGPEGIAAAMRGTVLGSAVEQPKGTSVN